MTPDKPQWVNGIAEVNLAIQKILTIYIYKKRADTYFELIEHFGEPDGKLVGKSCFSVIDTNDFGT